MEAAPPIPQLLAYLGTARDALRSGRAKRFVLGNEAADLDSMASAVAAGYWLTGTAAAAGSRDPFVPLVNIPRADYKLRTEAVYLLSAVGIEPDLLAFIDEVDLDAMRAAGELELVLVDHNALAAAQAGLAPAVTGIIDHHRDEGGFQDARPRLVEPVGSASTLVAAQLLEGGAGPVEPGLARLLLGTVLLDTVNLDREAKRATDQDVQVAARLAEICGADRQALFERLQFEKFNVDALATADLLRKDYKEYQMGRVRCGIASVLLPVARWLEKDPELADSLAAFARGRGLDLLLAMNAYTDPDFRRDLVIWADEPQLFGEVDAFLRDSDLGLEPLAAAASTGPGLAAYAQRNAAYSRKKLQPLLQGFLASRGPAD